MGQTSEIRTTSEHKKDKRPVPKVSFVQRLDCITYMGVSVPSVLIDSTNSMIYLIQCFAILYNGNIILHTWGIFCSGL